MSEFGNQLKRLKGTAARAGVRAMVYLQEGTPGSAIRLAERWVGAGNVVVFTL
ncbi:MAG: hypothetical protein ACRD6W_04170 [Nitrososphaerales archaeon]